MAPSSQRPSWPLTPVSPSQHYHAKMASYTLVVIARTQSLVRQLREALDPSQYLIRWVPSTSQALHLDLEASLLILAAPSTGGCRSAVWLKRRFSAPLLVLLPPGTPALAKADASLRRPFSVEELVAEIQTTLVTCAPSVVQAPGMSLDTQTHRLQIGGHLHRLRPTESRILAVLMDSPGAVVARDELVRKVWDAEEGDGTRALDVHISHLRRVVEETPRYPKLIVTVRGVGYRLDPHVRSSPARRTHRTKER